MGRMGRMGYKKWISGAPLPIPIAFFPSYPSHPSFSFPFTHKKNGRPRLSACRPSDYRTLRAVYWAGKVMGVALSE